jgi:uncharacterized membrane protein YfcA
MLFDDVTLAQYVVVAIVAFCASIFSGVAGYGTGLILPFVLVPTIGAQAVVPVIGLAALFANASRVAAFRHNLELRTALIVAVAAAPTSIVGAWGYTRLSGAGASILIGFVLVALVPLRRRLKARPGQWSARKLAAGGFGYGFLTGGTSGAGVMLISLLMASGLEGAAVLATDAVISIIIGIVKTASFQTFGALSLPLWGMALIIGLAAMPGGFIAKRLVTRMPLHVHTGILDAMVVFGGVMLIIQGGRGAGWL